MVKQQKSLVCYRFLHIAKRKRGQPKGQTTYVCINCLRLITNTTFSKSIYFPSTSVLLSISFFSFISRNFENPDEKHLLGTCTCTTNDGKINTTSLLGFNEALYQIPHPPPPFHAFTEAKILKPLSHRDLKLVSSLARVRNCHGSLFQSNISTIFLPGSQLLSVLSGCPLQRCVYKARVDCTFPQNQSQQIYFSRLSLPHPSNSPDPLPLRT